MRMTQFGKNDDDIVDHSEDDDDKTWSRVPVLEKVTWYP